jgi:hypothetical protein
MFNQAAKNQNAIEITLTICIMTTKYGFFSEANYLPVGRVPDLERKTARQASAFYVGGGFKIGKVWNSSRLSYLCRTTKARL